MKSIKELREQYQVITEKEDKEQRKLTALVRAGLFDAKKLPVLKRALEKGVDKMTPAEKKILIDLLDSLMNQVISNEPVYMKVKRNVQSMDEEIVAEAVKTPVTISDVPSIVVLKRKAVRVYPGGQQVGLYYSQQLDKYVTIPFGEAGIAEEVDLEEQKNTNPNSPGRVRNPRYRRRRYDDDYSYDDWKVRRAEEKPYEKLSSSERKLVTPGAVAGREILKGSNLQTIAAKTIVASLLRKGQKNALMQKKSSPEHLAKIASSKKKRLKLKAIDKNRSNVLAQRQAAKNAAAAKPKQSAATSGTMSSQIKGIQNQATITESRKLKLVRRQQINEYSASDAADDLIPGVSAYKNLKKGNYGDATIDAVSDIAGIAAGALVGAGTAGAGAAPAGVAARTGVRAGIKGGLRLGRAGLKYGKKLLSKYFGKKAAKETAKETAKQVGKKGFRSSSRIKRFLRRAGGLGMAVGALGGAGSSQGGDTDKQPKAITHTHTSQLKANIVAPERTQVRGSTDVQDYNLNKRYTRTALQPRPINETVSVSLDGNLFEINSSIANKLVSVYESLNKNNKQKMLDMLMNKETQNKIVEFVTRY